MKISYPLKSRLRTSMQWMLVLLFLGSHFLLGEDPNGTNHRLGKNAVYENQVFDANAIRCSISSYGPFADLVSWPKVNSKRVVSSAGLWVIGIHRETNSLRTAVTEYAAEFQPGPILTKYNTTTNKVTPGVDIGDPNDPLYHIYKIQKKDSLGGNPDYDNWPGDLGAPYIDIDGDGQWTPGVDRPKLWGDQELWCVYNDANPSIHGVGATQPIGIEVQATYFGFTQSSALGNVMFIRWKIINKSDADYDSVLISLWSDIDLGSISDNYAGVDVSRNLAFVYIARDTDAVYGKRSPAAGFILLQGPRIRNQDSTAFFEGGKINGYYNIPIYSHIVNFFNGDPSYDDPFDPPTSFPSKAYGYQNGYISNTGNPFIDPVTGKPTKFVMSGDPVTRTGWTMDKSFPGGEDVRSLISPGPFTLARGDTQEIVGAFVIAQGTDRLNSIELLRKYADLAQEGFKTNYAPPSPPPSPTVEVADLSNKIVMNWGSPSTIAATENYNITGASKNYKFEGYNIYQLGDPSSATSDFIRLATFDVPGDSVKTESDLALDPKSGLTLPVAVCYGNDTGIERFFVVDRDSLHNAPLINGKEYYFAVTAYAFNFDTTGTSAGLRKVIESRMNPITIIPRQPMAGNSLSSNFHQTLSTNRTVNGDDAVTGMVINPYQVTGGLYSISFNGVPEAIASWNLKRTGVGPDTVMVSGSTNFTGDDTSPIIDGLLFRVRRQPSGVRLDSQNPNGFSYGPGPMWFSGQTTGLLMSSMKSTKSYGGLSYPFGTGYQNGTAVKPWECKKVEIRFSSTVTQKAYRFVDKVTSFPTLRVADSSFLPYIINKGNGILYQDFVDVPFTVWETDSLDGKYAPRQLNVAFKEHNDSLYDYRHKYVGNGKIDGKWMPTTGASGGEEVLYLLSSNYSATPLVRYTTSPGSTNSMNLKDYQDSVDVMYLLWVKRNDTTSTFLEGDVFTIRPNYPLLPTTVFTIATPKNIVADKSFMKKDLARINIFPNPYFANNAAESSPYTHWVTITNLPEQATIRIFTLSGELLTTILHNDKTGFERWYLRNDAGLSIASGIYLAYISIKDVGTRILKIAVIQSSDRPEAR